MTLCVLWSDTALRSPSCCGYCCSKMTVISARHWRGKRMVTVADNLVCNIKIRISQSEYRRLKLIAASKKTTVSSILRGLIRSSLGLDQHSQKNKTFVQDEAGAIKAGARVDIRLSNEEAEMLNSIARSLNTSRARALVLMMMNKHSNMPVFSPQEKEALHKSNYYLRLIGSNLNQIAKHLHSTSKHQYKFDSKRLNNMIDLLYKEIDKGTLEATIKDHIDVVKSVLRAGKHRFD